MIGGWIIKRREVCGDVQFVAQCRQSPVATMTRIARTLDEVRALLPAGLRRVARDPLDDDGVIEVWL